jgi:hypothetical protein
MNAKQVLKKALSWSAVIFGLAWSVLGFGLLGVVPLTTFFHPPSPRTWLDAVTLFAFGAVPLLATVRSFRNRKFASLLCFIAAPLISLVVWLSDMRLADSVFFHGYPINEYSPAASAALTFVPLFLLGYFWSVAHRYNWPWIVAGTLLPMWARIALAAVVSLTFLVCICATSVRVASMSELPGDCGGPPPFSKAYTGHTVFLVRVVHVDRITGAMAVVQQRFAALPWWNKIVFLKFIQKKGTYFVDGRFEEGLVTRWLVPVLDLKCTGSSTIENAGVELRLFRDSPRWNGVHLIGRVSNAPTVGTGLTPAPGVTVVVDGPNSVETVTDRDGIYDVSGLPKGHYSIRVPTSSRHEDCEYRGEAGLNAGVVWGCELLTNSPE